MSTDPSQMNKNHIEKKIEVSEEEVQQLIQCLPKAPSAWSKEFQLVNYQGFWYDDTFIRIILRFQRQFTARNTDIFIASFPKTGTTWLKSLVFSVLNRNNYTISQSPLLKHNPHELVQGLETDIYCNNPMPNHHLDGLPAPRLLSTHLPYTSLPESIKASRSKILYITRNPSDTLVSFYYFGLSSMEKLVGEDVHQQLPSVEDVFEGFCDGRHDFGPYFDQVLEYWKLSLEQPDTVLFLKYEDLMANPTPHLKRLAEFIGMPFSPQEETDGVVSQIIELCSFKNVKELEVNKSGVILNNMLDKKSFFRKGEVGDWTNHLTPLMAEKMDTLMQQKFKDTGLSFKFLPDD